MSRLALRTIRIGSGSRCAAWQGFSVLEEHIYADEAQSGARSDRDGLNRLVEAARSRQFEAVVVDDLSRLARDNCLILSVMVRLRPWLRHHGAPWWRLAWA